MIWPKQTCQIASNCCQVKTDLFTAGRFEWKTRFTLLWPSDAISSWRWREKEAHSCQEKTATCGWERAWKWQRGFLSMFEEQLLTFTTKSSNMLSATSGLWAWQSPGFFGDYGNICRCLSLEKAQGSIYRADHQFLPLHPTPISVLDSCECSFAVVSQPVTFSPDKPLRTIE